jgi:hypothetical protein
MRAWIMTCVTVASIACHSAAPPPAAPRGPTACARASDNLVHTMLDREAADAMRNLIRERCEHDAWSPQAVQCLIAMKSQDDAATCAQLMTDDQQAALVRDEQAQFGVK